MLVTKDTQEATYKFFAVADIDARAEAAYRAYSDQKQVT